MLFYVDPDLNVNFDPDQDPKSSDKRRKLRLFFCRTTI